MNMMDSIRSVDAWLEKPKKLLIDGQWIDGIEKKTFDVVDPATGKVIAKVAEGRKADIDVAVAVARRTFESGIWRDLGGDQRMRVLYKIAELIEKNIDFIAAVESRDVGMPLERAKRAIGLCAEGWRNFAALCNHINGQTASIVRPGITGMAYSLKEPIGVAGLIAAWNGPFMLGAMKCGPALAAGCSAVLKCAEEAPLSSLFLGELMIEAGVPAGVINIVPGFGAEAGQALAEHPDVDKISFTGSTMTGKKIVAASLGNLKKCTLELGGKSPFIIFADADIDRAILASGASICNNTGQVCVAGSRLLVQRGVYDRVVEGVAKYASSLKVGPGLEPGIQMGPLISNRQLERVTGYIEAGKQEGGEVVTGGKRIGDSGFFVQPTVFAKVRNDMKIVREEIFGPVLSVIPFDDEDEALKIANDTIYGLSSYVWTQNDGRAQRVAKRIRAGTVIVNTSVYFGYEFGVGGYKQSGLGRENGPAALDNFLETKWVVTQDN